VLHALSERLPADAIVVEESPSSRPELLERIAIRTPLGFVSNANGGLGFGIPGAVGLRMASPDRGVVGIIGDGSAMYAIQGVWSAARYGVGVVLIVMANGVYEAMDVQARARGAAAPWPGFGEVEIAQIVRGFGCPAVRVDTYDKLLVTLDDALVDLAGRDQPLVIEVAVGIE
jgi:benzoylformate decarboxylase